jgi:4-amino-4-deoxy-L-arabinose transferase-like glycosyltransferase
VLRLWPELLIVACGILLRVTLAFRFSPHWGYDYGEHLAYIVWFRSHSLWDLPPILLSDATYNPPLYYWIAARFPNDSLTGVSAIFGVLRLGLMWFALERLLGDDRRLAIRAALALAAVLPASVFLDGQVAPESLNVLLCTAFVVGVAFALRADRARERLRWAVASGVAAGGALLTKLSVLVLLGAVGMVALFELTFVAGNARSRLRRVLVLMPALILPFAIAAPWLAHNRREAKRLFPTPFDCRKAALAKTFERVPYRARRPMAFAYGWTNDVLAAPYAPAGLKPEPRFFPVLVATTFADYYAYGFAPRPKRDNREALTVNYRPMWPRVHTAGRWSTVGGTVLSVVVAIAWAIAAAVALRRRRPHELLLVAAPALVILAQLEVAWRYPADDEGVVKSQYIQFGAAPLYALYGLAVARLRASRTTLPLLGLVAVAYAAVAWLTILSRLLTPMPP